MASRPQREIYRGTAIIMNISMVGCEDWKEWERKNLPEVDKTNAFKLVYDVAEGDANGARHDVSVEISHRELKGKMLEFFKREDGTPPTQIDIALRQLKQQGIIDKSAVDEVGLEPAMGDALIGKPVTIRAYEEQGDDGRWWPRCVFASKFARITGEGMAERLAAFRAGKPAPKHDDVASAATTAIPAPSDDLDDMPF